MRERSPAEMSNMFYDIDQHVVFTGRLVGDVLVRESFEYVIEPLRPAEYIVAGIGI